MIKKINSFLDKLSNMLGNITATVLVLMILNVFYDVVMRYFFNTGSIAMQEMEWHLFSVVILLGMAYTMQNDAHVRVDLVYDNLAKRKQAYINLFGTVLFVLPVACIIGFESIGYVVESYTSNEQSGDPGGLTNRWIIKSFIPVSFLLLIVSSVGFVIKQLIMLQDDTQNKASVQGEQQ